MRDTLNRTRDRRLLLGYGVSVQVAIVGGALATALWSGCRDTSPQALLGTGGIEGFVVVDRMPVPGVTVTLGRSGHVVATTSTNSNGRYEFENLHPGPHTLSISSVGQATCPDEQTVVVVGEPGEPVPTFVRVDFPCITEPLLPAIRGVVRGRVVVDGVPRSGAVVRIPGYLFTTTDAGGIFNIIDVLAGEYRFVVVLTGHLCPTRSVRVFTRLIVETGDSRCVPG